MKTLSDPAIARLLARARAEERAAILQLIERHMRRLLHGHGASGAQVLQQVYEEIRSRRAAAGGSE